MTTPVAYVKNTPINSSNKHHGNTEITDNDINDSTEEVVQHDVSLIVIDESNNDFNSRDLNMRGFQETGDDTAVIYDVNLYEGSTKQYKNFAMLLDELISAIFASSIDMIKVEGLITSMIIEFEFQQRSDAFFTKVTTAINSAVERGRSAQTQKEADVLKAVQFFINAGESVANAVISGVQLRSSNKLKPEQEIENNENKEAFNESKAKVNDHLDKEIKILEDKKSLAIDKDVIEQDNKNIEFLKSLKEKDVFSAKDRERLENICNDTTQLNQDYKVMEKQYLKYKNKENEFIHANSQHYQMIFGGIIKGTISALFESAKGTLSIFISQEEFEAKMEQIIADTHSALGNAFADFLQSNAGSFNDLLNECKDIIKQSLNSLQDWISKLAQARQASNY
ncbi:MAG: hypothetical protein PHC75_06145 [Burkholderiales bacterium]|nr:hypothetical protein [Burkholderiales bacterium]